MKDDAPRIFRSLEMRHGREGFDTIVIAAVASYGSLRSPSEAQAREFGKLVVPAWDKITSETRRALAASLSHSRRVPRELVEKLLAAPIEIAAPFLLSSPVLTSDDVQALAVKTDDRVAKILEGRKSAAGKEQPLRDDSTGSLLPGEEPTGLGPLPDAENGPDEDIAGRNAPTPARPVLPSPPLVPEHLAGATPAALDKAGVIARETLLRLARPGRSRSGTSAQPASLARLIALATDGDAEAFYAGLRSMLASTPERVRQIADDDTGEFLAVALKALKTSSADAMTILMMLKPAIGLDVATFDWMTRLYRALKVEECRQLLDLSRSPAAAPKPQPQFVELEPLRHTQSRPQFGRRKSRPAAVPKASERG